MLSSQAEQEEARIKDKEASAKPVEYLNYLRPSVSIALIDDSSAYPAGAVPDHVSISPLVHCHFLYCTASSASFIAAFLPILAIKRSCHAVFNYSIKTARFYQ